MGRKKRGEQIEGTDLRLAGEMIEAASTIEVALTVPLAPPHTGYGTRHLNVQLDSRQAATMKRLQEGLDADGARLANGRRVVTGADAVRFLLEMLAEAESERGNAA